MFRHRKRVSTSLGGTSTTLILCKWAEVLPNLNLCLIPASKNHPTTHLSSSSFSFLCAFNLHLHRSYLSRLHPIVAIKSMSMWSEFLASTSHQCSCGPEVKLLPHHTLEAAPGSSLTNLTPLSHSLAALSSL